MEFKQSLALVVEVVGTNNPNNLPENMEKIVDEAISLSIQLQTNIIFTVAGIRTIVRPEDNCNQVLIRFNSDFNRQHLRVLNRYSKWQYNYTECQRGK